MDRGRPYQSRFGHAPYHQQNTSYYDRSYTENDSGYGSFNQRREYSFNPGRNHYYDSERGRPNNQNSFYPSGQKRDNSFRNENFSNQERDSSLSRGGNSSLNTDFSADTFSQQCQYNSFSEEGVQNEKGFGQMKRERPSEWNDAYNRSNNFKHFKREDNYDEVEDYNEEGGNDEDEIESDNEFEENPYFENENQSDIDDEYDCSYNEEASKKVNSFIPDMELICKYKYFPPSPEEMGKIFNGLVIFFLHKKRDVPEKHPFVIICESFRRSDRFEPLSIEDGYQMGNKFTKFCTIRWNGMMMVRGVGYTGVFKEARVVAGVELINQLAMSCYSLQTKDGYYGKHALDNIIDNKHYSNITRIVEPEEVPNYQSACGFITDFFFDDNDNELIFKPTPFNIQLKWWAIAKGYEVRCSQKSAALGVCISRAPQYWRDKILASGMMENDRFTLIPPQGYGNNLLDTPPFREMAEIRMGKIKVGGSMSGGPRTMYAPNDHGLQLSKCLAPWSSRGGNRFRRGRGKGKGKKGNSKKGKKNQKKKNRK